MLTKTNLCILEKLNDIITIGVCIFGTVTDILLILHFWNIEKTTYLWLTFAFSIPPCIMCTMASVLTLLDGPGKMGSQQTSGNHINNALGETKIEAFQNILLYVPRFLCLPGLAYTLNRLFSGKCKL